MTKVYLAGAIAGLDYEGAVTWRDYAKRKLALADIEGVSPMRAKEFLKGTMLGGSGDHALTSAKGIVTRDRMDVMNADAVLACFLGSETISAGTMCEFGWADAWRVPIVTVMTEKEAVYWNHAFVRELSGFIVPTLDEALNILVGMFGSRSHESDA